MSQHAQVLAATLRADAAPASYRRPAANQVGFDVQVLTEYGWKVVGFRMPYESDAEARTAMKELADIDTMNREYRVYAALAERSKK